VTIPHAPPTSLFVLSHCRFIIICQGYQVYKKLVDARSELSTVVAETCDAVSRDLAWQLARNSASR